MEYVKAVKWLEEYLESKYFSGYVASVILWQNDDRDPYKIRVAEVGGTGRTEAGNICGFAYMSSDPDGLAVCAACERILIDSVLSGPEDAETHLEILDFLLRDRGNTT